MTVRLILSLLVLLACGAAAVADESAFAPGKRVLLDAHNCYPYNGMWADRVDRALATGTPVGIEMDLAWFEDPSGAAKPRIIVAHGKPFKGDEPGLRDYFFEKVRPLAEKALQEGNKGEWPLVTLNINDLRGDDPAFFQAVWDLAAEYEPWLCTAVKQAPPDGPAPLDVKPVLILTGGGKRETECFYNNVPVGGKLRLFGSSSDGRGDNFRRWVNYAWKSVEPEGQGKAGEWTAGDAARLKTLVDAAHQGGCWIRFYTINGHSPVATVTSGWSPGYNFGSLEAASLRWKAAVEAGVDFIATDQYEDFAAFRKGGK